MFKCWIIFVVALCSTSAYWDHGYEYPKKHFYDSGYGGSHDYHDKHDGYHYPSGGHHQQHQHPWSSSECDSLSDQWKGSDSGEDWRWNYDNKKPSESLTRTPQLSFQEWYFESCLNNCHTSPEYNPVCGTDGITYLNPSALQCVRNCGKNVNIASSFPCFEGGSAVNTGTNNRPNGNKQPTQPSPQPTQPSPQSLQLCIRNCPTTSEYNPVCGTNMVTYTNPSRLECAQMCGVDVKVSRNSRCPEFGAMPPNPSSPSQPPTTAPALTLLPTFPTPIAPAPVPPIGPASIPPLGPASIPPLGPASIPPRGPLPVPLPGSPSVPSVGPSDPFLPSGPASVLPSGPASVPSAGPTPTPINIPLDTPGSSPSTPDHDFTIPQEVLDDIFTTTETQYDIDERFDTIRMSSV